MNLPTHKKTKPSAASWLREIPAHWAEKPFVYTVRESGKKNTGMKEANLLSLSYGRIVQKDINASDGLLPESFETYQIIEPGIVVFRLTDLQNDKRSLRSALCTERGIITSAYLAVDPCGIEPRFFAYLMRAYDVQKVFYAMGGGMRQSLKFEDMRRLPIVAPDLLEQEQVVAYLDHETRRIDDLITEKGSFITLLKERRVAETSYAVTKGVNPNASMKPSEVAWLGDVPEHWDTVRLGVIFKEADRRGDPTHPVLSVSIHDGVSDEEVADEDRLRKVALSEDRSVYQGVMPGDLVYNMMRAWQGGFGAVATEGLVSPAYVVARPLSDARTKFIELQLRTPQAVEEMRRYSKGIADFRMRLYWEHFRNVRVALPSPEEQDAILANIERETTRIDGLIHETEHSIALLKEKRAALITAAVTGKIDVRNAA